MPDEAVITQERFPEDVIKILTQPIDPQALSQAPRGLTSIKSIYITERLNSAFGYGRWQMVDELITVTSQERERTDRKARIQVIVPMVVVKRLNAAPRLRMVHSMDRMVGIIILISVMPIKAP